MISRVALALTSTVVWIATGLLARDSSIHLPLAVGSVALIALAWAVDGERLRELLRVRAADVALGVGAGVLMSALTRLAYGGGLLLVPALSDHVAVLYRTMRAAPPLVITVPLLCVVIACEEIVWRGVLTKDVKTGALSVLSYTVAQLGAPSALMLPVAFGCGIAWTAERLWRRGLVAPYFTHLTWTLMTLVYLPLDR